MTRRADISAKTAPTGENVPLPSVLFFIITIRAMRRELIDLICTEKFPASEGLNAFLFHKIGYLAAISALAVNDEQTLEFGNDLFGDHYHSSAVRDKIMICKNDRSPLVAVVEYLRFHAVQAQSDSLFIGRHIAFIISSIFSFMTDSIGMGGT